MLDEIARLNERIHALEAALARQAQEMSAAAAAREARFRSLAESSQDVTIVTDTSGAVVDVTGNTMGLLGCTITEALALSPEEWTAIVHPEDRDRLDAWVSSARRWSTSGKTQARVQDRAGEYRWVEVSISVLFHDSGTPAGQVYLARDVSERVQAQEALVEAERLSALGQMAGGIAHDFNNILVGVLGYAEKALLDIKHDPQSVQSDLQRIVASANDAAEAVRRLQSLYRRSDDTSDFSPIDVDAMVQDVLALTEPTWKDAPQAQGITVRVETHLGAQAPVLGNASELRRVLRNLITNAIEAMPSGGRLAISTRGERGWVVIRVSDTGMGITEEQRERLFQPFFTTKPASGGGLGLTVSHNIVKRHGGEIDVSSTPGTGATFSVRLPAATGLRVAEQAVSPALAAPAELAPSRILVVEDEDAVRELLVRMLERDGHQVAAVDNGQQALDLLAEGSYDVVITDLGMPEISGRVIARRTHELWPDTPVILSTGWGDTITPEQLQTMGIAFLLTKPFSLVRLHEALSHALGQAAR